MVSESDLHNRCTFLCKERKWLDPFQYRIARSSLFQLKQGDTRFLGDVVIYRWRHGDFHMTLAKLKAMVT